MDSNEGGLAFSCWREYRGSAWSGGLHIEHIVRHFNMGKSSHICRLSALIAMNIEHPSLRWLTEGRIVLGVLPWHCRLDATIDARM